MRAPATLAGLALLGLLPLAAPAGAAPAECQAIAEDAARLACYDRLFPRPAPAAPAGWQVTASPSLLAGHTDRTATLPSSSAVACRWAKPRPVRLIVQCRQNVTSVAFETGCYMTSSQYRSYGDVTYRLDDGAPRVAHMAAGPDNDALGFWSGDAAIPFLKELLGASRLAVTMTPYAEDPLSTAFDLAGLEQAITGLRGECGW